MVADIGNGTMNVMILNNGKASESKSWTVRLGANECFMAIRNLILDRKAEELPAEIIENYLRYGSTDIGDEYKTLMEEAAKSYVDKIFAELKAHGYNPNLMKKRLSSIVREYKFDSVQAFYKEFNAAKKECLDYQEASTEWEKIYGEKAAAPMSIRDRLRQKEQIVKEREEVRVYQERQKDKGAR